MAQIEPLGECPAAFAALGAKINEIIAEMNARDPQAGIGMKLTRSETGTRYDIAGLTGSGVCNEEGDVDVTIEGQ